MELLPDTVERARNYWRGWAAERARQDTVSIVVLDEHRFARVPERLRLRLRRASVTTLDALIATLGDEVQSVAAEASLAYADRSSARLAAADDAVMVPDDDHRFAALADRADAHGWREAGADEPCDVRFGIIEHEALVSIASLQIWNGTLGHVGVYTDARARRRGLSRAVAAAAVRRALDLRLVAQWRARVENEASLGVADALGFVTCGRQFVVRVRESPETPRI